MAALTVGMSTQLYVELGSDTPQPILLEVLTSGGPGASLLVPRLLRHIIERPEPPKPHTGVLSALSSAAGFVLMLPWHAITFFFRPPDAPPLGIADRSLHLLLLLTQHLPPPLQDAVARARADAAAGGGAAAAGSTNGGGGGGGAVDVASSPFLIALRALRDSQSGGSFEGGGVGDAAEDPELGKMASAATSVSFRRLHDSLAASLPSPASVLLLYLLLHGNRDYLDYALSRTDPETLLLPLLRTLSEPARLGCSQLYMLLIVVLMLSLPLLSVTCMLPALPSG